METERNGLIHCPKIIIIIIIKQPWSRDFVITWIHDGGPTKLLFTLHFSDIMLLFQTAQIPILQHLMFCAIYMFATNVPTTPTNYFYSSYMLWTAQTTFCNICCMAPSVALSIWLPKVYLQHIQTVYTASTASGCFYCSYLLWTAQTTILQHLLHGAIYLSLKNVPATCTNYSYCFYCFWLLLTAILQLDKNKKNLTVCWPAAGSR